MSFVRTVLFFPFNLLSLFTRAKNFSRNPIIGSKRLNRLGLHRFRLWSAGAIGRFRASWLRRAVDQKNADAFDRDGFVAVENAISGDEVTAITNEFLNFSGPARRMVQGDCWTERILLTPKRLKEFPTVARVIKRQDIKALLAYTGTKIHTPLFYIQRLRHLPDKPRDPQKTMHSDTFHPTMKAWLFLEDIKEHQGPFTYVPGSHRFTEKRAAYETSIALRHETLPEYHSGRGSIRASNDALKEMGLPDPMGLTCKAGTLVVANTNGYHGRGAADVGATRFEIFIYSRVSPYFPLPFGLPDPFWFGAQGLDLWHRFNEWRKARKGAFPIWRTIPLSEMTRGMAGSKPDPTDASPS